MVVVMLLAQCALLVGYFADQSWKKKLPHDDTGEAHKVAMSAWIWVYHVFQMSVQRRMLLSYCRWCCR